MDKEAKGIQWRRKLAVLTAIACQSQASVNGRVISLPSYHKAN